MRVGRRLRVSAGERRAGKGLGLHRIPNYWEEGKMPNDEIFIEMCCSRCDRISWDSYTDYYGENCPVPGERGEIQRCDTLGRRMETDSEGNVRMFDKNGVEITTKEHLEDGE